MFDGVGIARILGSGLQAGEGLIARGDDRFQGFPFMGQVALCGFDEIGNEVVTTLELHFDLRESVLETVLESDEFVVDRNDPEHHDGDDDEGDDGFHAESFVSVILDRLGWLRAANLPAKPSSVQEGVLGALTRYGGNFIQINGLRSYSGALGHDFTG